MRRLIACVRRWWRERSYVTIEMGPTQPMTVVVARAEPGLYSLEIGGRVVSVRSRPWDTSASVARKMRRALRREGL